MSIITYFTVYYYLISVIETSFFENLFDVQTQSRLRITKSRLDFSPLGLLGFFNFLTIPVLSDDVRGFKGTPRRPDTRYLNVIL